MILPLLFILGLFFFHLQLHELFVLLEDGYILLPFLLSNVKLLLLHLHVAFQITYQVSFVVEVIL